MLVQSYDPCCLPTRPAVPREPSPRPSEPLTEAALALLGKPALGTRLSETRRGFPHVVNRLADDWLEPDALLARIDGLLLNDRPNRQGFPLPVVQELGDLRAYYVEHAAPQLRQLQAARPRIAAEKPRPPSGERRRTAGPGWFGRLLGAVFAH